MGWGLPTHKSEKINEWNFTYRRVRVRQDELNTVLLQLPDFDLAEFGRARVIRYRSLSSAACARGSSPEDLGRRHLALPSPSKWFLEFKNSPLKEEEKGFRGYKCISPKHIYRRVKMERLASGSSPRCIEFYSGVGGWAFSLRGALRGVEPVIVSAFDHSTVCNHAYNHNHGKKPCQAPIESLGLKDLDGKADLWAMSPPCQPHTRQRANLEDQAVDDADPRAKSFLHLTAMLRDLTEPPRVIVLENVVGFESSNCCRRFVEVLRGRKYAVEQFHLTPTQFGFPNERPRFYMVARLEEAGQNPGAAEEPQDEQLATSLPVSKRRRLAGVEEVGGSTGQVADYLELPSTCGAGIGGEIPEWIHEWKVDPATLEKDAAWCFDIVRGSSQRTACFTRSYGRFIKGTGSVLFVPWATSVTSEAAMSATAEECAAEQLSGPDALKPPEDRVFGEAWRDQIAKAGSLRYFTPREVSNLLGFPASFEFPSDVKVPISLTSA